MQTELVPIFKLRETLLQMINPDFFASESALIHRSSLAAQDYVLSGAFAEYKPYMGRTFRHLAGYVAVHQKYFLPYNPYVTNERTRLHPGLVMDLAWSFNTDRTNGIIDANGNIRDSARLPESQVLAVYHNSARSGTPLHALNNLMPSTLAKINEQKTK